MTVVVADHESEDPGLTKCLEECRSLPHYDVGMQKRCEDDCKKKYPPGKEEQQERKGSGESRDREDPEQRFGLLFEF